ncbi:MAG: DUF6141 family protein [Ginsengibacter sp.]
MTEMKNDILFSENQRFNQWWLLALTLGVFIFASYALIRQVFLDNPFINNPISNNALIGSWISALIINLLFFGIRLQTRIKNDGIYIRFFPFMLAYKHYAWDGLSACYVRQYSPLGEFGGWGYRFGAGGKAFNISGNKGLQLKFKNNKRLLIGTQKPLEIESTLTSLGKIIPA